MNQSGRRSDENSDLYEPEDDRPLRGLKRPDGTVTEGQRPARTLRLRNARVANGLPVSGWRVLDVGCAEGLSSMYLAERAAEVVGVDHRRTVITAARAGAEAVGIDNVSFIQADLRDTATIEELGRFDLVIAWGLLHRISDVYSLFSTLSQLSPRVSVEWVSPVMVGMSRISLARHPADRGLDMSNVGDGDQPKTEGQSSFWQPTWAAVRGIGEAFGYTNSRLLGYGDEFRSGFNQTIRSFGGAVTRAVVRREAPRWPTVRTHALMWTADVEFEPPDLESVVVPEWDTLVDLGG